MSRLGIGLGGRVTLWLAAFAWVALIDLPRQDAPVALGWPALPLGAIAGAGMFAALSQQTIDLASLRRERAPAILARSLYLTGQSSYEEVIWRGLLFTWLVSVLGVGPAFALSTAGFALAHFKSQGWSGAVHLATGTAFAGVFYLSGSLLAAIVAHAAYNVLIGLAIEAQRETCPFEPIGAPAAATYHRPAGPASALLPLNDLPPPTAAPPSNPGPAPAELRGVVKRFGETEALRGIDLVVNEGEILALLGPNGAGKTTSIGILLGLRRPDSGHALLFGRNPVHPEARRSVGATPQDLAFPPTLRVREIVDLVRAHFAAPLETSAALSRFGLTDIAARQAGGLSGGQRRRLGLALAFVGQPRAVFLDEPTAGLDVDARRAAWDAISEYAVEGRTVLLTTHYLEEAERLASRVVVIHEGRVVAEGSPSALRDQAGLKRIRIRADALPELPGVVEMRRENGHYTLYTADSEAVVRVLVATGVPLHDFEVGSVSLEEAFLLLTGGKL